MENEQKMEKNVPILRIFVPVMSFSKKSNKNYGTSFNQEHCLGKKGSKITRPYLIRNIVLPKRNKNEVSPVIS